MVSSNRHWRLPEGIRWIDVDDEVLILVDASGHFVELNSSAADLWTVMSRSGWSEAAAVGRLVDLFGLSEPDAQMIISDFLGDLVRNKALLCEPTRIVNSEGQPDDR